MKSNKTKSKYAVACLMRPSAQHKRQNVTALYTSSAEWVSRVQTNNPRGSAPRLNPTHDVFRFFRSGRDTIRLRINNPSGAGTISVILQALARAARQTSIKARHQRALQLPRYAWC